MVNSEGALSEIAREDSAPRAVTFSPNGTLFIAREDGAIVARSTSAPPERTGDGSIIHDLPVQGTLTNDGSASHMNGATKGHVGDQITISAVDLTRTDALDIAVRLIGPDGGERAYNDDQLGIDLYGRFDAQIPDFVLRDTGTYVIVVEWVQGAGTYTLGVSANRHFELNAPMSQHVLKVICRMYSQRKAMAIRWAGRAGRHLYDVRRKRQPRSRIWNSSSRAVQRWHTTTMQMIPNSGSTHSFSASNYLTTAYTCWKRPALKVQEAIRLWEY